VNGSHGVNGSNGVNWSDGVHGSNGVHGSYGVINSSGVDRAMFLADKQREFTLFGKVVSGERFNDVWGELHSKLNGWYPKFNNAVDLYLQNGNDWKKVDASKITSTLDDREKPYEAWKDMPKDALEYVKSLPEFDAEVFRRVTGIDVSAADDATENAIKLLKENGYKIIKE
jgi:hypothetical protein